jgi:hypothetical protein
MHVIQAQIYIDAWSWTYPRWNTYTIRESLFCIRGSKVSEHFAGGFECSFSQMAHLIRAHSCIFIQFESELSSLRMPLAQFFCASYQTFPTVAFLDKEGLPLCANTSCDQFFYGIIITSDGDEILTPSIFIIPFLRRSVIINADMCKSEPATPKLIRTLSPVAYW